MKTKKKPARRAPAKPSTALALRPRPRPRPAPQTLELKILDPERRLDAPAPSVGLVLGEDVTLGNIGLVELKLTEQEEKVCDEAVLVSEVRIKPTGAVYVPHIIYTRWMNRAFGRVGWVMVPAQRAVSDGKSVVCAYTLFIHGLPVKTAYGEQEYFASNNDQTYGDALEATRASGLRRLCKQLGMGLELWDHEWGERFKAEHCVQVWRDSAKKPQWRLKREPPFFDEKGPVVPEGRRRQPAEGDNVQQREHHDRAGYDGSGEQLISNIPRKGPNGKVGQVQRLKTILKNSGRDVLDVKAWMALAYGYASSTEIKRKDYDAICSAIESKAPLPPGPLQREREVGEEG